MHAHIKIGQSKSSKTIEPLKKFHGMLIPGHSSGLGELPPSLPHCVPLFRYVLGNYIYPVQLYL